ncbi:hypothetical protein D0Y96_014425 [Acidipila sp. 4G-K13]|uniref:DUF91 domain-containing protein n=1 Tax=Paracidobacterium acidisoli TaxID=2303751 RepID=A0A372IMI0_9BACT|nr:hypothetical protein [Paracidobacterium acidisoli]
MTAVELGRALEAFFADFPRAAVLEEGRVLFDMRISHWSLASEHGRCMLHLWSEERNLVRSVTKVNQRRDTLHLETRRFGQTKPQGLTLVRDPDRRTPTARDTTRKRYLRTLERVLPNAFPGWKAEGMRTAMDLEHSFGPAYARGLLVRGNSAWAVIGVNAEESPATIDGALTLGILWLAYCREHGDGRRLVEGLKVIVPEGCSETTAARMVWMDPAIAKWELHELDERADLISSVEARDQGNLSVRLMHAFDPGRALERMRAGIDRLTALLPVWMREWTEVRAHSATEVGFLLHGLEYARVRHAAMPGSFAMRDEITFGAGAHETPLDESTEGMFRDLMERLGESRKASGSVRDPLFRMQAERWLESELRRDLAEIEPGLRGDVVYSQVPAFAGRDRAMLDLLTVTRQGRLAVLELKADEDLHLPLQALDYWARVRQLQRTGEFRKLGYFAGVELADAAPVLYLVAPALRVHPANEIVLKHFSPEVPWELIALDEQWRKRRRVIFRKRATSSRESAVP